MPDETDRQAILDHEHLKLLSWGYMVSGGMTLLMSLFAAFYVAMGTVFVAVSKAAEKSAKPSDVPPEFIGWFFAAFGLAFFFAMALAGSLKFYTAHCIRRRKSRTFCQVIAALSCLELPYGTFLGVCTFIVLGRESVARLFAPPAG